MATFLDIGILKNFSVVFTWLLVYVVVYGLLEWNSPFGKDKKNLHVIVAFAVSFLVVLTQAARYMVEFLAPWFLIIVIVVFFILLIIRMFGLKDESVVNIIKDSTVYTWLIVLSIVLVIVALGAAFGQQLREKTLSTPPPTGPLPPVGGETLPEQLGNIPRSGTTGPSFSENVLQIFIHPKVLGMLFILLLGTFTIYFLSKKQT